MRTMPVMPREAIAWTVDDLDRLPDDGLQYELLDGLLLVSPAPLIAHQRVVVALTVLLHAACSADHEVLVGPLDFRPHQRTSLQPDVLVVRRVDLDDPRVLRKPPALAVEVISPSSRHKDLELKRSAYAEMGVGCYWVVDPEIPALVAWELVDGAYVEVARATGEQPARLERPCPVEVVPGRLTTL